MEIASSPTSATTTRGWSSRGRLARIFCNDTSTPLPCGACCPCCAWAIAFLRACGGANRGAGGVGGVGGHAAEASSYDGSWVSTCGAGGCRKRFFRKPNIFFERLNSVTATLEAGFVPKGVVFQVSATLGPQNPRQCARPRPTSSGYSRVVENSIFQVSVR
jgi:hypothetical protein